MVNVLMHMARTFNVLHQIDAVGFEGSVNAFENTERFRLIMNGVEGADEIEGLELGRFVKIAQIGDDKLDVPQFLLGCLFPCKEYCFAREIDPCKPALRIKLGQPVDDSPASAAYIQHMNSQRKLVR